MNKCMLLFLKSSALIKSTFGDNRKTIDLVPIHFVANQSTNDVNFVK
jgi:hypothetical protein